MNITLIGPGGTTAFAEGKVDTAADDTVFSQAAAVKLGIDLTACPSGIFTGVSGAPLLVRYARVTLRLSDGVEELEWSATVGFAAGAALAVKEKLDEQAAREEQKKQQHEQTMGGL